jgi:hypothetical protein
MLTALSNRLDCRCTELLRAQSWELSVGGLLAAGFWCNLEPRDKATQQTDDSVWIAEYSIADTRLEEI